MREKKTDKARSRTGDWVERYVATGGTIEPAGDWVRATIEYPRELLQFAREAAADQPERLRELTARALAEEVRRLAFTYPPSGHLTRTLAPELPAAVRPRPARRTTNGGRRRSRPVR